MALPAGSHTGKSDVCDQSLILPYQGLALPPESIATENNHYQLPAPLFSMESPSKFTKQSSMVILILPAEGEGEGAGIF